MRSITVAMALLSSVVAADSVTTLFLPSFDPQPLVASVVGSDATATTYSIACAPGTDSSNCGAGTGFTLIEGPKTVSFEIVDGDKSTAYADVNCDINPSVSEAVCTVSAGGSEANFPGATTSTFSPEDYKSALLAVTITAGSVTGGAAATTAASATAPTASATTKAAAAASGATTAASTGSVASALSTLTSSASSMGPASASASAKSSAVSTGGMPQITGNAQWAMGGVAVAVAFAAM